MEFNDRESQNLRQSDKRAEMIGKTSPNAPPTPGAAPPADADSSHGTAADAPPGRSLAPARALPLPAGLETLAAAAQDYARGAKAQNTNRAYAADWRHFSAWARRRGFAPLPPAPEIIGLYLAACASEPGIGARSQGLSVRTIERRLSALAWHFSQRGAPLDRGDRHIAEVMAGIRRRHGRPPEQKEAVLADDLRAMLATLDHGLRGLRDRAILLIGFAGGLRRSEIVGLDCGRDETGDATGWIAIEANGLLVQVKGKTGWREVEIGRGFERKHLPHRRAGGLAEIRQDQPRPPLPPGRPGRQDRRLRTAHRQACGAPGQAGRDGGGRPRRPLGG